MAAVFLLLLILLIATLPPRQRTTSGAPDTVWSGAFHIHSTDSDGGGTREEIARAAARAGLRFVILTDHGDGTRAPRPPEYIDGVLVIDGVEIGTRDGHYAAFGLRQSPYPLGGPAAGVIEDVTRLGGFGAAAHPRSAKRDLRWRHDGASPVDAYEVINGDSAWRDERALSLLGTIVHYPFRPASALAALIEQPAAELRWIERESRVRRVVMLSGADAHGRLPLGGDEGGDAGWALPIPSYEQAFRAAANVVDVGRAPSQDAVADAAALGAAMRAGRVTLAVTALAAPASMTFTARTDDGREARMGDRIAAGPVTFDVEVADVLARGGESALRLTLLRGDRVMAEAAGPRLTHREQAEPTGVWRVEARLAHAPRTPWLLGNPIVLAAPDWGMPIMPRLDFPLATAELTAGPWAIEKQPASEATLSADAETVAFTYQLADGAPSGQYGAAVREAGGEEAWSHVVLRAHADEPTRLWVQLRLNDSASGQRWGRSVYLDRFSREVRLALDEFIPLEPTRTSRPHQAHVRAVLIVVDTVNSAPGRSGRIVIERLALELHNTPPVQ